MNIISAEEARKLYKTEPVLYRQSDNAMFVKQPDGKYVLDHPNSLNHRYDRDALRDIDFRPFRKAEQVVVFVGTEKRTVDPETARSGLLRYARCVERRYRHFFADGDPVRDLPMYDHVDIPLDLRAVIDEQEIRFGLEPELRKLLESSFIRANELEARCVELNIEKHELVDRHFMLAEDHRRTRAALLRMRSAPFWTRLKWVFTGVVS
jgi:hypothetical protein